MDTFLSCDWGTSSFRLRLIGREKLELLGELKNDQGISGTFSSWQQAGTQDRQTFYLQVIRKAISQLKQQLKIESLKGVPIVLSGMASSTIGLMELPYKKLPFHTDGTGLEVKKITLDEHPVVIISGVCTEDDVMRGEETKIVGVAPLLPVSTQEQLLILPGTHPKHVVVSNQQVLRFETYMTGEFFEFLSMKTILSGSVKKAWDFSDAHNRNSFIDAVAASGKTSLLHHSFMVRTNELLKKMPKEENYHYLSGLLIGEELKTVKSGAVYLLGSSAHMQPYALACEVLRIEVLGMLDADEALVRGQQRVLMQAQ